MAEHLLRQELYDLVWSQLMPKLAGRFGILDVALKKTCARRNFHPRPWLLGKEGIGQTDDPGATSEASSWHTTRFSSLVVTTGIDHGLRNSFSVGAKAFTTFINLLEVLSVFYAAGWTVDHAVEDAIALARNEASVILLKEGFVCHLPPADVARLAHEFVWPETLVEGCELLRKWARRSERGTESGPAKARQANGTKPRRRRAPKCAAFFCTLEVNSAKVTPMTSLAREHKRARRIRSRSHSYLAGCFLNRLF